MAAATLQKEKDAAAKDECNAKETNKKSNAAAMTSMNVDKTIRAKAPMEVSPPSVPDLTSLLTGHIGCEGGQPGADGVATTDIAATDTGANSAAKMDMDTTPPVKDPVDNNVKSPKKRNRKKQSQQRRTNCQSATAMVRASKRAPLGRWL